MWSQQVTIPSWVIVNTLLSHTPDITVTLHSSNIIALIIMYYLVYVDVVIDMVRRYSSAKGKDYNIFLL